MSHGKHGKHGNILSDDSHRDDCFIHAGMNKGLILLEES